MLMTLDRLSEKISGGKGFYDFTAPVVNDEYDENIDYYHVIVKPLGNNKEDIYANTCNMDNEDYYELIGTVTVSKDGYSVKFCDTIIDNVPKHQIIAARFFTK